MRAVVGAICCVVSLSAVGVARASSPAVDPQVAGLQAALAAKGFYGGVIDGIRGGGTVAAVVAFQRAQGLEPDGVAGPQTRAALGVLGRPLFGTRVIRSGMTGWDVAVLQFLLARHGPFAGPINGHFGPLTRASVVTVQRSSGLTPDGEVGPQTANALCDSCAARPTSVRGLLDYWAGYYALSAHLVRAVAWKESNYVPGVVSPAGARGVMQVKPTTWDWVEAFVIRHPVRETVDGNIQVGVAYLRHLLGRFDGNTYTALAAYNQGPASVAEHGIKPDSGAYARDVLTLARRL